MRTSRKLTHLLLALCALVAMSTFALAADPGQQIDSASIINDQKEGSVLIYNIYTSSSTGQSNQNTSIAITNTSTTSGIYVHLFFVDGSTCAIADSYICLTATQTSRFLASDVDPGVKGYIIAVAVNSDGCPVNFNHLIGDLYVKFSTGHAANLGAEALSALYGTFLATGVPTAGQGNGANPVQFFAGNLPVVGGCNSASDTATLNFSGVGEGGTNAIGYNKLPRVLAVDNIPSRLDGNDTMLIVNRIGGSLLTGATGIGTLFGILYDDAENALSYQITASTCQLMASFSNSFPRSAPRFEQFVPAGRSGWTKFYNIETSTVSEAALVGAVINYNGNAAGNSFNGGHNLHKLTLTRTNVPVVIPVFPPAC